MSDALNWKRALFLSNMPLKYEAAKVFSGKGFTVYSDYKYARRDSAVSGEITVDIRSHILSPVSEGDKIPAHLEILSVCDHCHPDAMWLFSPDPNRPEASPAGIGSTIRVVDNFSSYTVDASAVSDFESGIPICWMGLEINEKTGDVSEAAPGKNVNRLQYAIPRLLTENVLSYSANPPRENLPFTFCPILLTTARLFVLNPDAGTEKIEAASSIEDIATEIPYIVYYSDYGPDFESQCRSECSRLEILHSSDKMAIVDERRARFFNTKIDLPYTIIDALSTNDRFYLEKYFTRFFICSHHQLSEFIDNIFKTVKTTISTQTFIA